MFNSNAALKLTHSQCSEIPIMILDEFPHESLEDFVLSFRKGITGRYDEKLLRLDVQVIFRWIRCHLEEKAERREILHKQDQIEETKPYTKEEKQRINDIINSSWVGQSIKKQQAQSEAYDKFKAEYLVKQAAKKQKRK